MTISTFRKTQPRKKRWPVEPNNFSGPLPFADALICPTCQTPLTFIAVLTDPGPLAQILAHIGEPTSPPLVHPARGPPQTELDMGRAGGEGKEADQESSPVDLDQTPEFDSAEPEPIPEDHFDQSRGA